MKGKPWSPEQEKQLKDLVAAKTPLSVIAKSLGKPEEAVRQKIRRLELEVVEQDRSVCTTTSIVVPKDLPSVEETLGKLAGALDAACKPGLDKVEVQRLQVVATLARTYKDILVDYADYRGLEVELMDLRAKYEELSKKSQSVPPK